MADITCNTTTGIKLETVWRSGAIRGLKLATSDDTFTIWFNAHEPTEEGEKIRHNRLEELVNMFESHGLVTLGYTMTKGMNDEPVPADES